MRADKMKSTMRADGQLGINMRMEVIVSTREMALHTLHRFLIEGEEPLKLLSGCNKRQVYAYAREDILSNGLANVEEAVKARYTDNEIDLAIEIVTTLFPEMQK